MITFNIQNFFINLDKIRNLVFGKITYLERQLKIFHKNQTPLKFDLNTRKKLIIDIK